MKKIIFMICILSNLSVQSMTELLEGDYLSSNYIESIKKTFSTRFDFEKINGCRVEQKEAHDIRIVITDSFHEGLGAFTVNSNGTIDIEFPQEQHKMPKLKILNKESFNLEWEMEGLDFDTNKYKQIVYKGQYHFVGKEESKWIAKQILEGTYRAADGSEIKFKSNNFACLPNGEKKYNVHPDVFEGNFPYDAIYHHFIEKVFEVRDYSLGFSRIGDELLLYKLMEENNEYAVESMPFWRGTRIDADPNQPCDAKNPQAQVSSKVRQLLEVLKETKSIENSELIQRLTEEIKQTASIFPHNKKSREFNDKGLNLLKEKKYLDAVKAFNEAYYNNPQDIEINNNLGYAYLLLEANIHAEAFLLKTLSLDPNRTTAWANLGEYYVHHQQETEAVASILLAFYFSKNPIKTIDYFNEIKKRPALSAQKIAMLERILMHPFIQQRLAKPQPN